MTANLARAIARLNLRSAAECESQHAARGIPFHAERAAYYRAKASEALRQAQAPMVEIMLD